jgi:hypothetical protein
LVVLFHCMQSVLCLREALQTNFAFFSLIGLKSGLQKLSKWHQEHASFLDMVIHVEIYIALRKGLNGRVNQSDSNVCKIIGCWVCQRGMNNPILVEDHWSLQSISATQIFHRFLSALLLLWKTSGLQFASVTSR